MQVWQGPALAGVYLLVPVPALKRYKAAQHAGTLGYCFWLDRVVFLHALLQHRMQIASREQCSGYADADLGFLLCKMGL